MDTMIEVTMDIHTEGPRVYMTKYHRYEPVVKDHTQVSTFMTCPTKYFYQIVLGRIPRNDAPYFAWGSAYHKFREVIEIEYGYGENVPELFDEAKAKLAAAVAIEAGLEYWKKRGTDQPLGSRFEFMTSDRLLKSFLKAFEHWKAEKKVGRIQVIAVEQAFNVQLADGSSTSGRADQIIRWNGKLWGRDFKTTSKDDKFFSRALTPNDQFTRYTFAEGKLCGEQVHGQIIETLFNAKSTKTKQKGPDIFSHTVTRTPQEIDAWEREQEMWHRMIDSCRELDIYPMAPIACAFCEYHSVCSRPTEGARMAQLEAHYTVRPWDNTKIGE